MNVEDVVATAVRGRSSIYKGIHNEAIGFDSRQLFELFKEFFDAIINEPIVDVTSVQRVDGTFSLFTEDGVFRVPVDKFVAYDCWKSSHVLIYFKREPAEYFRLTCGTEVIDGLVAVGLVAVGGRVFSAKVPLAILATNRDGELACEFGLLGYTGDKPDEVLPDGLSESVLTALTSIIWCVNNEESALKVPAVRRTLNQVAKRKH